MAAEDLLGAGLDIEGWSYLKGEVAQKISELTDRSLILRSTFPMIIKSKVCKYTYFHYLFKRKYSGDLINRHAIWLPDTFSCHWL